MFNGMMMSGAKSAVPPPAPDVVTVTGGSGPAFWAINADANANLYLKFTSDGDVFVKKNDQSYAQRASSTDWVRPVTSAPGLYQIRFTGATGDTTYLSGTKPEDVWHDIVISDFIMHIFDQDPHVGKKTAIFTIEFRFDDGDTLNSGLYTIAADRRG